MRVVSHLAALAIAAALPNSDVSQAQGHWDVLPTPVMRMEEAGISVSVESIAATLGNEAEDEQLRFWAAMALGQLGDERAVPHLILSLSDANAEVRRGAAGALMFLPSDQALPQLCRVASTDVERYVRLGAINALSSIRRESSTHCLVSVASNEYETKELRIHTLSLLMNQSSEREGFDNLLPTLMDPDPEIRGMVAAILSIAHIHEPELLKSLAVTEVLVDVTVNAAPARWIYLDLVTRLEEIAGQQFISEDDERLLLQDPDTRIDINGRIKTWAKEAAQ